MLCVSSNYKGGELSPTLPLSWRNAAMTEMKRTPLSPSPVLKLTERHREKRSRNRMHLSFFINTEMSPHTQDKI